jgi:hypothetical protein
VAGIKGVNQSSYEVTMERPNAVSAPEGKCIYEYIYDDDDDDVYLNK